MEIIKIIHDLILVTHNNQRHLRSFTNLTFIIYFIIIINSFSQTISRIQITGEKVFSANDYLSWSKISTGSKYFAGLEDSVKSRITSALEERGYLNSSIRKIVIEKIDSVNSSLFINVSEGKPTLINKIKFGRAVKDSTRIAEILSQLENQPLTNANMSFALSEVLDYYENIGYPFSSIRIESVELTNPSGEETNEDRFANLILYIDEGVKSKIDKIEIQGNDRTKDFVITRALHLKTGQEYSQKKIDEIPDRLNRLRFFEPVEQPEFYFNSKQEGVLKISIKEKQTNYFDGILGYVPAVNDKERGYLTGFINVNMRNLFGTGRAASFRWQQENRSSQELELHYLEPWLFDLPFNIEGSLLQRKQDSTYVQRNLEGSLEYLATDEISASIIIGTQSTIPSELNSQNSTVFNSTSFTTGVNFRIDTRDDFYAPTKGIYLNNSYKFISKRINGPTGFITPDTKLNISLQRLEFDFTIFSQLFQKQVAAIGVHGRELRGDNTDLSDLYFLGGANTLRGYREKQFQGNRIFWSNLEYRFLLSKRSFTFLFLDSGYFLRNEDKQKNIPEISSFKIGYGFGLNIETGLGVLGVSFALAKGDSFGDGKIHFGIINEF
ncbi:MAG: BamA/TamA family outer membrane protein [Ignavibacteriales bacterium]|nr:BamA/TamA family outer membrane protein [Ignavibacteriales bacterium]